MNLKEVQILALEQTGRDPELVAHLKAKFKEETGRIVAQCVECDNKADVWADDPKPLCEWCYHAQECEPPATIEFYSAHLTGEGRARCTACNFVSAYWECGCELEHDCTN